MANKERAKVFETKDCDFSKFGFFPTKKDMERSARDKKKYIHASTVAMLEALNFRVEFPKAEEVAPAAKDTANKVDAKRQQGQKEKNKVAEVKPDVKPEATPATIKTVEKVAA